MKDFFTKRIIQNPEIFFTLGLFLLLFAFKQKNINISIKKYWLLADTNARKILVQKIHLRTFSMLHFASLWTLDDEMESQKLNSVKVCHLFWQPCFEFLISMLHVWKSNILDSPNRGFTIGNSSAVARVSGGREVRSYLLM